MKILVDVAAHPVYADLLHDCNLCGHFQKDYFDECPECGCDEIGITTGMTIEIFKDSHDEYTNYIKETADLKASAAEAHLHINLLHSVIKSGDLRVATKIMADWEVSQCQC